LVLDFSIELLNNGSIDETHSSVKASIHERLSLLRSFTRFNSLAITCRPVSSIQLFNFVIDLLKGGSMVQTYSAGSGLPWRPVCTYSLRTEDRLRELVRYRRNR
jgi:hypothetical protein